MTLPFRIAAALVLSLPLLGQASAEPVCAGSISELRAMVGDPGFASTWQETTMQDGKPMTVSLHDTQGGLLLRFTKSQEGLWAESSGSICQHDAGLRFKASESQLRLGPAANWLLRLALAKGGGFALSPVAAGRLRISTRGWSGEFVPQTP